MSRIGKQPIEIPSGVEVQIDGSRVTVKGPRGTLEQTFHDEIRILRDDGTVRVERPDDDGFHRSLHGLTRTLVANMVEGVTKGYEKRLDRKSTRLNSSHSQISYAVFCLKKNNHNDETQQKCVL